MGRVQQQKRSKATVTKIMGQDDTDTNNEGIDDNKNNNGDQATKTNIKEYNDKDNHRQRGQ
jgi:hypothetical protein